MFKEFKEFISRGNVMDMAIGIIIGGAFSKIVTSLVNDILMPIIGIISGGMNVSDLHLVLKAGETLETSVLFKYGAFLQAIIDFLIIAFTIFVLIKAINKFHRKKATDVKEPEPVVSEEILLLREIRDNLKK